MPLKDILRRVNSKLIYGCWESWHPGDYISFRAFDFYRCIFIHIPKAAGTSVSKTLFGNAGAAHTKLTYFEKLYAEKTFRSYFKFTFVRNPYDRIFSAYNYLKKGGGNIHDKKFSDEHLSGIQSFEAFVLEYLNETTMHAYVHLLPQVEFLKKKDGTMGVDFIGRYESLDRDFNVVRKRLGITRDLSHDNPTTSRNVHYSKSFTDEMRRKIYLIYNEDFRELQYPEDI